MNIDEAIRYRRSVRKFSDKDISKYLIEQIVEAGRWAPSGQNNQERYFIVTKNRDIINMVSETTDKLGFIKESNALIFVVVDENKTRSPKEDAAAAIENMLLKATSLNIGSCWIWACFPLIKEPCEKQLQLPEGLSLQSLVVLGYSTQPISEIVSKKKSLQDVIRWDKF